MQHHQQNEHRQTKTHTTTPTKIKSIDEHCEENRINNAETRTTANKATHVEHGRMRWTWTEKKTQYNEIRDVLVTLNARVLIAWRCQSHSFLILWPSYIGILSRSHRFSVPVSSIECAGPILRKNKGFRNTGKSDLVSRCHRFSVPVPST